MRTWHLITGAYPPQSGGVSDYTEQLCQALASQGATAHVWAPALALAAPPLKLASGPGVIVHRLEHGFGVRGLRELGQRLGEFRERVTLLVQYVPHAFGYRAMNLPFCVWLATRRKEQVWVMFHEAVFPFGARPVRTNVIAAATHVMAALLVNGADRVLVSTPDWERRLRRLKPGGLSAFWLPVPSNLPTEVDASVVARRRAPLVGGSSVLLGHFGTYGAHVASLIDCSVPSLLAGRPERRFLLLGRGSKASAQRLGERYPELRDRILSTGELPPAELALHLAACDVLVQPYPDGLSTRRTSLMAGLALGVPTVSNHGHVTEPDWRAWGAVAIAREPTAPSLVAEVERQLASPHELSELGKRGAACYRERFSMSRTVEALSRLDAQG
jgi:glycosyltransferase involved in cell wall biosynthesis